MFGRGMNRADYTNNTGGASWDYPFETTVGGTFISEPVPAQNVVTGDIDFVGQGTNWQYYHARLPGNSFGWQGLEGVSGTLMGPPAAAYAYYTSASYLEVVGQGTNGWWYHQVDLNGTWQPLYSTNGVGYGAVSVVAPPLVGALVALGVGTDFNAWTSYLRPYASPSWSPLPVGPSLH